MSYETVLYDVTRRGGDGDAQPPSGIHLAFVELRTRLRDLVHDYGLLHTLDRDHFYTSIDEALSDIAQAHGGEEPAQ